MTTTASTTAKVNLDELFAKAIKEIDGGVVLYESDVLITSVGQKFKLIIHQLVWYAVKLFVEVDPRLDADDLFVRFDGLAHIEQITVSEHTALKGAEDKRDELLKDILTPVPPNFVKHLGDDDEVIHHRFFLKVRHGKKVLLNPDAYFSPGDHVQVEKVGGAAHQRHAGIYMGDRKVIQVSADQSEGASKDDAVIEEVEWEKFHNGEYKFFICDSIIRLRSAEQIAQEAKSRLGTYPGKYGFLSKTFCNTCQFGELNAPGKKDKNKPPIRKFFH